MAGRTTYSEHDKARVYVVLTTNQGNVKRTARDTGVPEQTVRRWRDEFRDNGPPALEIIEEAAGNFLVDAERVRDKALLMIEEKLDGATVSALVAVVGMLTDKVTIAKGLATGRVEHTLTLPPAEEVRAMMGGFVQSALEAARRREEEIIDAEIVEQPALPPGK